MLFALLLGGLFLWLHKRGSKRQAMFTEATPPQATNDIPDIDPHLLSRPRTINEMADLVAERLKERTTQ